MKTLLTLFIAALLAVGAIARNPPAFVVLGATEAQLVARYGKGREVEPLGPATSALCFDLPEFTIRAEFLKGSCGYFALILKKNLSDEQVEEALKRAGGVWTPIAKVRLMWRRDDGGLALVEHGKLGGFFRAETGEFYKMRNP